jgi:hypothetical protein
VAPYTLMLVVVSLIMSRVGCSESVLLATVFHGSHNSSFAIGKIERFSKVPAVSRFSCLVVADRIIRLVIPRRPDDKIGHMRIAHHQFVSYDQLPVRPAAH